MLARNMSKLYVFLVGCFSITCGYSSQVEALHESDDKTKDMKSILLSLNNSKDNDDHRNIYSEIDSLINATASLGIKLGLLSRNKSETEILYAPAFGLDLQDYENDSKNHEVNENILNLKSILNETIQNSSTLLNNTTYLSINGNIPRMTHNQTDILGNSESNHNDYYLDNTNQTASESIFENEFNFMRESNNYSSEDINFKTIQNFKLNVSKIRENASFIIPCPVFVPHSLTHKIDIKFSILSGNIEQHELSKLFEILLRQALREKKCESVVLLSLTYGAYFIYSWTNASVSSEYCDNVMLTNVEHEIFNQTELSHIFTETFLPSFRIEDVTILKLGVCVHNTQQIISGTVAVIVMCALTLLPCCFLASFKFIHYRKCKDKTKTVLKPTFPVILDSDNFTTKSHEPTSIHFAFEEEIRTNFTSL